VSQAVMTGTVQPNLTVTVKYGTKDGRMVASSVKVAERRLSMIGFEAGDPDTTNGHGVQTNPGN
jgi:hypothetical protein